MATPKPVWRWAGGEASRAPQDDGTPWLPRSTHPKEETLCSLGYKPVVFRRPAARLKPRKLLPGPHPGPGTRGAETVSSQKAVRLKHVPSGVTE